MAKNATKGCEITINGKTFSSDYELDTYLYENRAQLEKRYEIGEDVSSIFSLPLTSQGEISAKLDEINGVNILGKPGEKAVGASYLYKLVGLIGKWKTPYVDYGKKTTGDTEKYLNEDDLENKTDKKSFGSFFHKLLEYAINDVSDISSKRIELGKIYDFAKFGLKQDFIDDMYSIAKSTVQKIREQYPDCIFKSEYKFYARDINPEFLQLVKTAAHTWDKTKFPNEDLITNIVAVADLVVITKDGRKIVIDWKTSDKPISRTPQVHPKKGFTSGILDLTVNDSATWSKAKRKDITAQLALESIILEQNQMSPDERIVVNFVVQLDEDGKIKTDNGIYQVSAPEFYRVPAEEQMRSMRTQFAIVNTATITTFKEIHSEVGELIPNASKTAQERDLESRVNWYLKHKVLPTTGANTSKGKFVFFKSKLVGGTALYAKHDKEELRGSITEYLKQLDATINDRYKNIAEKIKEVTTNNDPEEFEAYLKRVTHNDKAFFHLKKYIDGGWSLDTNEEAIANGFFIFSKEGRSELVVLIDDQVKRKIDLGKDRTTILGLVKYDSEYGTDTRYILPAEYGRYMEIMAMSFISRNQDRFRNQPITEIKVISTEDTTVVHDDLWRLQYNWNELKTLFKDRKNSNGDKINLISIDPKCFIDDGAAALLIAEDLVKTWGVKSKIVDNSITEQCFNAEYVTDLIENLIKRNNLNKVFDGQPGMKDTDQLVLLQLLRAYSYFAGHNDYMAITELDVGRVFSGNNQGLGQLALDGTMMLSANVSKSANFRILGSIVGAWKTAIRLKLREEGFKWQTMVAKIQEEGGYSSLMGGEFNWFENWFVKTPDGKIDPDFILKDPNTDPYFQKSNKTAEKEACKYFLKYINAHRKPNSDDPLAYYRVPLVRAKGLERFMNLPLKEYLKERVKDLADPFRDDRGASDEHRTQMEDPNGQVMHMYNPFENTDLDSRTWAINEYGVEHYTKNLDIVFLQVLEWNLKTEYGEHFMPIVNQMRMFLAIENGINDAGMNELEEAVQKYIQSVIFNENIVETTSKVMQSLVTAIKELTTFTTLAGKTELVVRDTLTNAIKIAKESIMSSGEQWNTVMEGFDKDLYISAMWEAIQEGMKAGPIQSKSQQLNAIYGSFGFGFGQMSESMKSNRYGLLNWDSSTAYWTSSAGDYLSRNALLIMKLKSIGAYDAYIENENGMFVYDMSKDPNYDIYYKYKEDISAVPASEMLKYQQQAQLYHMSMDRWIALGGWYAKNLEYGKDLPQALDPQQQLSLLTQSDRLFGNFDKDTRALISRTLLGQMVMQFKTYGYAQLVSYIKTNGAVNIFARHFAEEINPEIGKLERKVLVVNTPEEQQRTGQYYTEEFESKVPLEVWKSGRASYRMDAQGVPYNGKFQSWVEALAVVFHASDKDWERIMKNSTTRFNLLASLFDLLFASIFSLLLQKIYGEDAMLHMSDKDWWTRWSYNVVNGIITDGSVLNVMESMFSDGTVPMVPILKRYFDNFISLAEGRSNIIHTTVKMFGATNSLSSYFDNNE